MPAHPIPRHPTETRPPPTRATPLISPQPTSSSFLSVLLLLSPLPVHPRPTKLAQIHSPLLPPSSGPSPVVRGASAAPPPQPPHLVTRTALRTCASRAVAAFCRAAGSTSDRRHDRPLAHLPPSPAPPPASSPPRMCSTVVARSPATSAAAPRLTTCTPWAAAMEAAPLAAQSPLASQYLRQHLIHLEDCM